MRILDFFRRKEKAAPLQQVDTRSGGILGIIRESFAGAWQQGIEVKRDEVISFFAVYACVTLIAADISKMAVKLTQFANGIWEETLSPAFSPVLRKPNSFQTRIKFFESWVLSKLLHGNTYVLKQRDARGVVVALYVLDPGRVKPLVAEDGSIYYEITQDLLARVTDNRLIVPASEIIHDRMFCLFHPLVGVSPIYAAGLAATQGARIQTNSARLFQNGCNPGGILTAPGDIPDETAKRLKEHWEKNYTGDNVGKVAVLGSGLKYEAMTITAVDAQLLEQLKFSAEMVCSVYHVPAYMIGVGQMPAYNNIEALNQQYYSQCLQSIIENLELSLDEGLALPTQYSVEFDEATLLRMDSATRFKAHAEAIGAGWKAPNEVRREENLPPAEGGDSPYMQQQNYSLAALSERDKNKPFEKPAAPAQTPPANEPPPAVDDQAAQEQAAKDVLEMLEYIKKGLACEAI